MKRTIIGVLNKMAARKGHAVECATTSKYNNDLGVPDFIYHLKKVMLRSMPLSYSKEWNEKFLGAINTDANLELTRSKIIVYALFDLHKDLDAHKSIKEQCPDGYTQVDELLHKTIGLFIKDDLPDFVAKKIAEHAESVGGSLKADMENCRGFCCCKHKKTHLTVLRSLELAAHAISVSALLAIKDKKYINMFNYAGLNGALLNSPEMLPARVVSFVIRSTSKTGTLEEEELLYKKYADKLLEIIKNL